MRLTCPNCGAAYEVADGMVPAAGRHVQCTVCHTRWFVAGAERAPMSEDRIIARLETLGASGGMVDELRLHGGAQLAPLREAVEGGT